MNELMLFGVPVDFWLFGATLAGVAAFHRHTLPIALAGLAAIVAYKLGFTGFRDGPGLGGLAMHMQHEWVLLANLFLLLTGFELLARHFEKSRMPDLMPALLADDWWGALQLLALVFVFSGFLDNIAAAMIGGTVARHVFRRIHMGYLVAIVAASNAGGAGSVIGDTTTTMMWIHGISPLSLVDAYLAAGVAFLTFGIPAAICQQRFSPIVRQPRLHASVEWSYLAIVFSTLAFAALTNMFAIVKAPALLDRLPVIGLAVWAAILSTSLLARPDWRVLPQTSKGTLFLLALVTCASMMPVNELPQAGSHTAFGLGVVSAVFDNIPLTALALKQGGYDWSVLAYTVGFGGSMIWFGSSAGVALTNMFPEGKSAMLWLRHGWQVPLAYVAGFAAMLLAIGWHPD